MRRRTLLRSGVAAGIVGLAGCAGDDGEGEPTAGGTESPVDEETSSPTDTSDADQVVEVGPDGSFTFAPDTFEIEAGDTVLWRFEAGGHNVRPDEQPEGSEWTGTEGGDGETYDRGHTHDHTFDVPGEYAYYCSPHQNAGMTGSFTVE